MAYPVMRWPFDEEDVVAMVRRVFAGRVVFHDGDEEIAPGVSLHHVGGHTMGMQIVRVETRRGVVVLASDASHLYANIGVPCIPVALNSGLFWPRRAFLRYPGTIVVEFLDPIPPGLPVDEFFQRLRDAIETATARLVAEGRAELARNGHLVAQPASK